LTPPSDWTVVESTLFHVLKAACDTAWTIVFFFLFYRLVDSKFVAPSNGRLQPLRTLQPWSTGPHAAAEVECMAKHNVHKPYEFGRRVSATTTNARSPGGR